MQFLQKTKVDTASSKKKIIFLSIILSLVAILALTAIGFGFGINFKGSTEIALRFSKKINIDEIKPVINKLFEDAEIKHFKHENQFVIHVDNSNGEVTEDIINALQAKYSAEKITLLRLDVVGHDVYKKSYMNISIPIVLTFICMILFINIRLWFSLNK